jgi:putative SOS response-associated peptidase YedK
MGNIRPRYNAAPSQELLVIRQNQKTGEQLFAIAMKDGSVFGLWENWKNPTTGQWERSFAIITVPSNDLVGQIHDRMPAILKPESYGRWLGPETAPHVCPSAPMRMWPISTRVNSPENDDASLLDGTTELSDVWAPLEGTEENTKRALRASLACVYAGSRATPH